MHVFISAGEPSGDLHAANLTRAILDLKPHARIVGFGGEHFAEAGGDVLFELARLSVMWFPHVLRSLGTYTALLDQAENYFRRHRPDVVVLIDYPGFHWWLARAARRQNIPVYYFVPPQLWAWGAWRVRKLKRSFDGVICSLPFEVSWFARRGVRALYFGHPMFDEMARRPVSLERVEELRRQQGPIVSLLPGSRRQEVIMNWPSLQAAAEFISRHRPDVRFLVAAYSEMHAEMIRRSLSETSLPLAVLCRETPEAIHAADVAIAVSGSVSLELLNAMTPSIITYRIHRFQWLLKAMFMNVKYMSLVNILANEEVFPEFLSCGCRGREMADAVIRWLDAPDELDQLRRRLAELRRQLATSAVCRRVAEYLLATCPSSSRVRDSLSNGSLSLAAS